MTGWMILLHGRIKIVENAAKGEFLYKILGVFLCILFLKKQYLLGKILASIAHYGIMYVVQKGGIKNAS